MKDDSWVEDKPYPIRAYRWAQKHMPMRIEETYTINDLYKYIKANKEQYYSDLQRLGLTQNTYDRFI